MIIPKEKKFPLRDVLTVTTGRVLTKRVSDTDNGIGDLYDILKHMSGRQQATTSLGPTADLCVPKLLELFPELHKATAALPKLDSMLEQKGMKDCPDECIDLWLAALPKVTELKAEYPIGQLL